ncbi:ABC transporter permease [Sporolactobacillus terrae]|uniref:ABC transporter permease n=1 Tax=Sporolactobacillus terrae TaxID=269673 RepID=A0ABX5QAP1_9BACL|nr:ABC transporter permease [Sporolactobacillus terrae]QAA23748.1 ABC transporter permease [Sporolactobacillus terrae]QAA26719.1 ABC transporter permease [Sporolactobacillus terrae]
MRNLFAMARRIISQIVRDKRTLALLIIAPLLILTLVWYIFGAKTSEPNLAIIHYDSSDYMSAFAKNDYKRMTPLQARQALADKKIDAYVDLKNPVKVHLEGSDPQRNGLAMSKIQESMQTMQTITVTALKDELTDVIKAQQKDMQAQQQMIAQMAKAMQIYAPGALAQITQNAPKAEQPDSPHKQEKVTLDVSYLHANDDLNTFDAFGPAMVGIFVFLFIFMIGGVSFLRERTTGTLDRLMASPMKNYQIIWGYMIGFGLFVIVQSFLLTCYIVYVLQIYNVGHLLDVLIIVFILSFSALSLSILLSTFASNELQMFQFIPLVIVPQVFLSGLFPIDTLPGWVQAIGNLMPIHYSTEALRNIMIRGSGFSGWWLDGLILILFSAVFITINILVIRRQRPLTS